MLRIKSSHSLTWWLSYLAAHNGVLSQMIFGYSTGIITGALFKQYSLIFGLFVLAMAVGSMIFERIRARWKFLFYMQFLSPILVGTSTWYSLFQMSSSNQRPSQLLIIFTALIVGVLAGGELPLINRLAKASTSTSELLVADYFAMALATLLFGIFFLPRFGILTSWLILTMGHFLFASLILTKVLGDSK